MMRKREAEALARKARLNERAQVRAEELAIEVQQQVAKANASSQEALEQRREQVQEFLESWERGCVRAEQHTAHEDLALRQRGSARLSRHAARLQAFADTKKRGPRVSQLNDQLKKQIQTSLAGQAREERQLGELEDREALAE